MVVVVWQFGFVWWLLFMTTLGVSRLDGMPGASCEATFHEGQIEGWTAGQNQSLKHHITLRVSEIHRLYKFL